MSDQAPILAFCHTITTDALALLNTAHGPHILLKDAEGVSTILDTDKVLSRFAAWAAIRCADVWAMPLGLVTLLEEVHQDKGWNEHVYHARAVHNTIDNFSGDKTVLAAMRSTRSALQYIDNLLAPRSTFACRAWYDCYNALVVNEVGGEALMEEATGELMRLIKDEAAKVK